MHLAALLPYGYVPIQPDDQALTSTPFQNATCPAIFAAADFGSGYSQAASLLTFPFTSTS